MYFSLVSLVFSHYLVVWNVIYLFIIIVIIIIKCMVVFILLIFLLIKIYFSLMPFFPIILIAFAITILISFIIKMYFRLVSVLIIIRLVFNFSKPLFTHTISIYVDKVLKLICQHYDNGTCSHLTWNRKWCSFSRNHLLMNLSLCLCRWWWQ